MRTTTARQGRRLAAVVTGGLFVLSLAGCSDRRGEGTGDEAGPTTGALGPGASTGGRGEADGTVTVLAAASLGDAFAEVEVAFEEANPGARVDVGYGGSSALRDQILTGQPVDVFAPASGAVMDDVVEAGAAGGNPHPFASNTLEIAVPAGNPAGVRGLEDFGDDDLLIGLCAEEVPCGEAGRQALANAGVEPAPDTDEPDVRSLLDKVSSGELDAGLVYATDVRSAGDDVEGIELPEDVNVVVDYPIVALTEAPNAAGAAAFVDYVLSAGGQAILEDHGFGRDES